MKNVLASTLLCSVLSLGACSGLQNGVVTGSFQAKFGVRFDRALRYVPSDSESLWIADCSDPWVQDSFPWRTDGVDFVIVGSRAFRPCPTRTTWFEGDSESVWVFVTSGATPTWFEHCIVWNHREPDEPTWQRLLAKWRTQEVIRDVVVSKLGDDGAGRDNWFSVPAPGILVRATSREAMEAALSTHGGALSDRLAALGVRAPVRPGASMMIARGYECADAERDWRSPWYEGALRRGEVMSLLFDVVGSSRRCVVETSRPDAVAKWLAAFYVDVSGFTFDGTRMVADGRRLLDEEPLDANIAMVSMAGFNFTW